MIVPEYWAEGRIRERVRGRQVTVRRFGWSDSSQEDAQSKADSRALDALGRIIAGETTRNRDPKVPYGGADGIPIREEILSRHGDAIVTRNVYGARCLNTPNVLFADIDFGEPASLRLMIILCGLLAIPAIACAVSWQSVSAGVIGLICAGVCGSLLTYVCRRAFVFWHGGLERLALRRIDSFIEQHPDWHLRLYRTPAGLRVLVMHQTFRPEDPFVAEFFNAIRADPIYVRMCVNQNCFRARVGPKPWRIGINSHLKPRPGVWPINPERLPDRISWVESYEQAARAYASCRFIAALGGSMADSTAHSVMVLHDEMCQATEDLPIA